MINLFLQPDHACPLLLQKTRVFGFRIRYEPILSCLLLQSLKGIIEALVLQIVQKRFVTVGRLRGDDKFSFGCDGLSAVIQMYTQFISLPLRQATRHLDLPDAIGSAVGGGRWSNEDDGAVGRLLCPWMIYENRGSTV